MVGFGIYTYISKVELTRFAHELDMRWERRKTKQGPFLSWDDRHPSIRS